MATSNACIRDACRRVRQRMYVSFQAHPGTPPVGGSVTGNRYPSASSSNYYYRVERKEEAIVLNVFVTIKILNKVLNKYQTLTK